VNFSRTVSITFHWRGVRAGPPQAAKRPGDASRQERAEPFERPRVRQRSRTGDDQLPHSSPIFTIRAEPQQLQEAGASTTTPSRGKWSGNGVFAGGRRSNAATEVSFATFSAAIASSVAAASSASSGSLHLVDQPGSAAETSPRAPANSRSAVSARVCAAARAARRRAISEAASDMPGSDHDHRSDKGKS